MKKIIIYKFKVRSRKPVKYEIHEIGYIIPYKNGHFEVHADSSEIKEFIENALNKVIKRGIFKQWSKLKNARIIEYTKILNTSDLDFPEFLSEQLFEPKKKLGKYIVTADIEERFKQIRNKLRNN